MSARDTEVFYTYFGLDDMSEMWSAEFSKCDLYRYTLSRIWNPKLLVLVFILLNPSTATHELNDPTITRCIERAQRMGYGGVSVLNLFAWRATDPNDMKAAGEPIGMYNDQVILEVASGAGMVICGWGKHGAHKQRDAHVLAMLRERGIEAWALAFNKDGSPRHPLYVGYDVEPQLMAPKIILAT